MGGGTSKPAEQPAAPLANKDQNNVTPRSNKKVSMFWKRKFGNAETIQWVEFIDAYKTWLRETFPDVLDDEEFDNLMSEEAEKALRHVLCYRKGHRKPGKNVALATLGATYPTGPDLFICTKQLISRSIRQYTQDMRSMPQGDDENEARQALWKTPTTRTAFSHAFRNERGGRSLRPARSLGRMEGHLIGHRI